MMSMSALQSRALALALAGGLAIVSYAALVRPLLECHHRLDERIASLGARVDQYRRLAGARESAGKALEKQKQLLLEKRYYLSDANPALASAELQGYVRHAVEEAKGELTSTQGSGGQQAAERPSDITIKVRARGDIRAVLQMLHTLESAVPLLFVDNLSIQATASQKELAISFEVSGVLPKRRP